LPSVRRTSSAGALGYPVPVFSARLPPRLTSNPVSRAIEAARRAGRALIDLTESNPTAVGLEYPPGLPATLADPRGALYVPSPFGLEEARRAVVAGSGWSTTSRDATALFDRVVLTSSTSEAYSCLFKLLCDAGDEVLVPRPSYPLFELLTALDNVHQVPYRLDRDGAWAIDRASIESAATNRTRALLVVSPNNPTGSFLKHDDREWLVDFAIGRQLALISDEVFSDYPLAASSEAVSLAGESRVLTFTLGGLSKSVGLPQMKLAWMRVSGPDALVAEALERLAIITDSYLSVSTPVQLAAAALLEQGRAIRRSIQARLTRNLESLVEAAARQPSVSLSPPEGGWSALVRVPAILSDDELVVRLIEQHNVIVYPGYFFDFEGDGYLVVSLLPRPEIFEEGISALLEHVAGAGR
jgi:aspartate/methionine/tyrosine aminotransferase